MKIQFTFKNFEPSEHMRNYARKRFEKLSKYIRDNDNVDMQVNLSVDKFRHVAEVLVTGKNIHISANEKSEDMYSTIDMVLDKVEAQLRKQREKNKDKHKTARTNKAVRMDVISFTRSESGESEKIITSTDQYEPKPMVVDEAAMQLENLNYEFLVFLNAETERVNVLYRRKNGDFGLIDPGFA